MDTNDHIAYLLEKEIITGVYKAGDRLPAERLLAQNYQTSRNRIREAIIRLVTLGLLRTEPQSGTYVCNYQKCASFDLFVYLMENHENVDSDVFFSMMQMRELMEKSSARAAAGINPAKKQLKISLC
jgi:GntR family transcriptional repressor for pyruvate dehydrogenase complex